MDTNTLDTIRGELAKASEAWVGDEQGVTAIEYALLAALIAVAIVGAVSATGTSMTDLYTRWSEAVINAL